MKKLILDHYEKQILEDFEKGEFKPVKNEKKEMAKLVRIAKNTLQKTKNINIRLSQKDLLKLKAKAAEHSIPYQTLATMALHDYANRQNLGI